MFSAGSNSPNAWTNIFRTALGGTPFVLTEWGDFSDAWGNTVRTSSDMRCCSMSVPESVLFRRAGWSKFG